jgi:glycosyltransferase involved in cell wall biosynthesis
VKILMVTIMPPQRESWGAIPVLLHGQIVALRPHHDITLLTLVGDDGERAAVSDLQRSGLCVHAVARSDPGPARRLRMAMAWAAGAQPKRTVWNGEPGFQHRLDGLLRRERFDLIHVEDVAAGAYRYRCDAPKILTDYEVIRGRPFDWQVWKRPRPLRAVIDEIDWRRWPRHQASIWRRFDRVQVFSSRDAASVHQIAPDVTPRVRVNPFCLELPPPADGGRERPGSLLFVGSFLHPPNVDAARWLILEIMPLLRERAPGVTLTIAGADPRGHLHGLSGDDVDIRGYVPNLQALIEESAVIVAPVRIGGGQRMKVLYGMAAGKAVVTTPRGVQGLELAAGAGAITVATTAREIADGTLALLASADMRRQLGSRARAVVQEHFGPDAYARRAGMLYDEVRGQA